MRFTVLLSLLLFSGESQSAKSMSSFLRKKSVDEKKKSHSQSLDRNLLNDLVEVGTVTFPSAYETTDDFQWNVTGEGVYEGNKGRIVINGKQILRGDNEDTLFGESFALSRSNGEYLAVGSWSTNSVHIYRRTSGKYTQTQTLSGDGGYFGYSVALSADGTMLAVAAPYTERPMPLSGSVTIYKLDEYNTFVQIDEIVGEQFDQIGVELLFKSNGKYLVMASPFANSFSGVVEVFERQDSGHFSLKTRMEGESNSFFGYKVDATDDLQTMVVASPNLKNTGVVFIYHLIPRQNKYVLMHEIVGHKYEKLGVHGIAVQHLDDKLFVHIKEKAGESGICSWAKEVPKLSSNYEGNTGDERESALFSNQFTTPLKPLDPVNLQTINLPQPGSNEMPETVDLFIIAGQNNAQGYGLISDLKDDQKKQDGLFYTSWHNIPNDASSQQYYSDWATSLEAGSTRGNEITRNVLLEKLGGSIKFGVEMGFVSEANNIKLTNNKIGIIKYAVDQSSLVAGSKQLSDWDLDALDDKEGDCWRGFQNTLYDAVSKLNSDNVKYNFKGMIWWQGESGTSPEDLQKFIQGVRTLLKDYGVSKPDQFPIVITGGVWEGGLLKQKVADKDDFVEIVDASQYGQTYVDGVFNMQPGSSQHWINTDITNSGNNDVWDIGLAYAQKMKLLLGDSVQITPSPTIAPTAHPTISMDSNKGVDIFIIAGQSNAHGFGLLSDLSVQQKQQNGMFYTSWHRFANNADTEQYYSDWAMTVEAGNTRGAAVNPRRPNILKTELGGSNRFGIELGFLSKANKIHLTDKPIGIIKYAVDGSVLKAPSKYSSDWDMTATGSTGGDAWRGFQNALDDATAKLKAQNIPYTFKGLLWWQGESGTSVGQLTEFLRNVRQLFGSRYAIPSPTEFPIVITGGIWAPTFKRDIADKDPYTEIVDASQYGQGLVGRTYNIHPGSGDYGVTTDATQNGVNDIFDIGEAYAEQMQLLMGGSSVQKVKPTMLPTIMPTVKEVTLDAIDIFLVAGQSNAHGFALVSDLSEQQSTQEGMFYTSWHRFANNAETTQYFSDWAFSIEAGMTRGGSINQRRPNILKPELGGSTTFGIEMGFASAAKNIKLTSNKLAIIKYAVDGSNLKGNSRYASDWDMYANTQMEGDCWRGLQKVLDDATAKLKDLGIPYNFRGMIWWQGESGRTESKDLQEFIAGVRNLLGTRYAVPNSSKFPIVITGGVWEQTLKVDVADKDDHLEILDVSQYGQTYVNGMYNIHPGSKQLGIDTDVTGSGNNDMWDIGEAYAAKMKLLLDNP